MKKVFMLHLKVDRFCAQTQVPKSITLIFSRLRNRWHFRAFSSIMYARTRFFRLRTSGVFVDSWGQSATFSRFYHLSTLPTMLRKSIICDFTTYLLPKNVALPPSMLRFYPLSLAKNVTLPPFNVDFPLAQRLRKRRVLTLSSTLMGGGRRFQHRCASE